MIDPPGNDWNTEPTGPSNSQYEISPLRNCGPTTGGTPGYPGGCKCRNPKPSPAAGISFVGNENARWITSRKLNLSEGAIKRDTFQNNWWGNATDEFTGCKIVKADISANKRCEVAILHRRNHLPCARMCRNIVDYLRSVLAEVFARFCRDDLQQLNFGREARDATGD